MKKLTDKEAAFVDQWLLHGSKVKAYIVAYQSKMVGAPCRSNAKKVGRRPHVRAHYEARRAELEKIAQARLEERHGITVDLLVEELKKVGFSSMGDFLIVTPEGYPAPNFANVSAAQVAGIRELTYKLKLISSGRADRKQIREISWSIRMHDKCRALIAIGKAIGMYRT